MRLVGLYIDGYGIFRDFTARRDDLDGAPTVIYGLNEAGKSTFMSFVRGILFGFKAEGNKPRPVRGGRAGGWLLLEDDGGNVFRVQRTGRGDGKVVVELPDGTKEGEAYLKSRILQGISPVLFRNVFAVGMDELRKLDDLKREEVSAHIYGAGTGVSPDKLARAAGYLHSSMRALFNPRGRVQEINKLLKELGEVDRRVKQLEQQPALYLELKNEQAELEKRQESLGQRRRELERRKSRLENLVKARDSWAKMQSLTARLKELQPVERFPEDGISRLEKLLERRNHELDAVKRCNTAIKGLREKLDGIKINFNILEYGPAIKSLSSEISLYVEKRQKLTEKETEIRQLEEQVKERLADLGPRWDEDRVLGLDLSLAVHRQVEDFGRRFRVREKELNDAVQAVEFWRKEVEKKEKSLREIENELSAFPDGTAGAASLEERFAVLERLSLNLHNVQSLEDRIKGERRRYNDLESRRDFVQKNLDDTFAYKRPGWISWAAAFLGAAGLFVVGLNAGGLLLLAGGAGLAVLIKRILDRINAEVLSRRERLRQEAEKLEQELRQVKRDIEEFEDQLAFTRRQIEEDAGKLGGDKDLSLADLPEIRRRLEREREDLRLVEQLENQREKAAEALEDARKELENAGVKEAAGQEKFAGLQEEWQQWCAGRGFPRLGPADMISFLNLAEKARDSINKLRISREEYRQVVKFVDGYVARVNEILKVIQMEPATRQTADALVANLTALLEEHEAGAELQKRLQERLEEAVAEKEMADFRLAETENSIRELLALGQAREEEEFRARAAVFARRENLKQEIARLREHLLSIAGSPEELDEFCAELAGSTREDNLDELEQVKKELEQVEKQVKQITGDIAEKKLRIKEMESGEDLARARQERDMLKERLAQRAREWRVYALCSALLSLAKEKHERHRQPGVLLQASKYIGPMTCGRYSRVVAPVGSPEQLEVERPSGQRVEVANLSRGAANQLYLALRLALARHYGSVVSFLPIMLDDVMVDFDPERLEGAVKVLGGIAAEHQVFIFTCHRHILEVISGLLPGYKCLILADGTKAAGITLNSCQ